MTAVAPRTGPRDHPGPRIQGLLIPASEEKRCSTIFVDYSAVALSEAIGGGLLADMYYGDVGRRASEPWEAICCGQAARFCFYADEDRVAKRFPANLRAAVLAARLGCIGDLRPIPLLGDVLVTGATPAHDDTDVPNQVLEAARRGGLLHDTKSIPPKP